jgi:hypothetical protein
VGGEIYVRRSLIFVIFPKCDWGDYIKEDKMDGVWSR